MHTFDRPTPRPIHAAGTALPSRLAAVVVFTLMLFFSACSDTTAPAAPADAPSLLASANSHSWFAATTLAASDFAVLANAAVTCTDGDITGDVGTYLADPTGSITLTACPVAGTLHVGDGLAEKAFEAFLAEYESLAWEPGDECTMLTGTLDGVTLAPGTYCFDAAAALTGTLTLDGPASGTWIFKIGTLGTGALTGTNFSVVMAGGGEACNVTWWVAEAATMTTSNFLGNILAGAAITMTGGTFHGNAWSQADVTITGTATSGCEGSSGGGSKKEKCNQGVGNGPEGCDPGNSNNTRPTNDENGGTPGSPGRKGKP
ncbi:MAG TPA: ice-binding family protein [Longimicrobiales bacterium]|nr:ice-binding family protein [Longimicrobiales bacterium]